MVENPAFELEIIHFPFIFFKNVPDSTFGGDTQLCGVGKKIKEKTSGNEFFPPSHETSKEKTHFHLFFLHFSLTTVKLSVTAKCAVKSVF